VTKRAADGSHRTRGAHSAAHGTRRKFKGRGTQSDWPFLRCKRHTRRVTGAIATLAMLTHLAYANVIVSTTRAIVPMPPGNTTVRVTNVSSSSALVRIWADRGNAQSSPDSSDAPFEISPALFVLGAQQTQVVRIDYEGDADEDTANPREMLFWLNVLDVPARDDANSIPEKVTEHRMGAEHDTTVEHDTAAEHDNVLRFVVRSRIKLIVRPAGCPVRHSMRPSR
jgi:P pilus assembly chaperone PapD